MSTDALKQWKALYAGYQQTSQSASEARAVVTAALQRKIAGGEGPTQAEVDKAEHLERLRTVAAVGLDQFAQGVLK